MKTSDKPNLVIFDQAVAKRSPAGSCVLAEVEGLSKTYAITVFSNSCEVSKGSDVEWIRIPLPSSPLVLRYLFFQVIAPLRFFLWNIFGNKPKFVQTTQGQFPGADIAYAHFCHRAYLKGQWKQSSVKGGKRLARFVNHSFNSYTERKAFSRARKIVVPSEGLARELAETYPTCSNKIEVLANPVDLQRFARPLDFNRQQFRLELGFGESEIVCVFVALGDFSRKGLGLVIDALAKLPEIERNSIRVLVVGGNDREISEFSNLAKLNYVDSRLSFVGLQSDVCPYLWASDTLVFPSSYEIFSLAILQAAAAGLPAMVPLGLYGAEEFIEDGVNGWLIQRSVGGVKDGLSRIISDRNCLPSMSISARASVERYSRENFVERWRHLFDALE